MNALRDANWRAAFELLGRLCQAGEGLGALALASGGAPKPLADADGTPRFTPREHQVLHWLVAAKSDREIAGLLGCSHRTVHKHLQHIYVKLGVETRTAAVMRALRLGLR